jgi:DNA uptake protein ComE-like DNA-binding protein
LRNHPYISFYQAKAITDYRRSEGDIKSPAQLSFMEEFTEQDLISLEPYISFE